MRRCECKSNEFYATEVICQTVIVDSGGLLQQDFEESHGGTIDGPYECTSCGKVYENLEDIPELENIPE